jgi:ankyrin repeat protein
VKTAEPLYGAVCSGASFDVLSCLANELGADVNGRGEDGLTALAAAAYLGYREIVRYLFEELGANVNSPDKLGQTPLFINLAAANGDLDVVRLLLTLRANIDQSNNEGITPLMFASGRRQVACQGRRRHADFC